MRSLSIDLETYSSADLSKCGVYRYVESPDFEILLFGWSVDGEAVHVIDFVSGETLPKEIHDALIDDSVLKWAHNAQFERVCLSRYLGERLRPNSWRCTMVWSACLGLPLSLEGAALVTGAEKQKLSEGKELVRYFCSPCRPTKANGGRTRNLPAHAPEKWERFKAYNLRDVEAEQAIAQRLSRFPVSEEEWKNYALDQKINDRGIQLDRELVRQAIRCDRQSGLQLTAAMRELTDLQNPNSVVQMKEWLGQNGLETDTLGKATVAELLKTAPEQLSRVLTLRQSLAKSSVKKYTAMENAVCADGRARGLLQFYGASRTGRFAGRLVQVQNLPQNHLPDLGQARQLVKDGNFAALEALYDSVSTVLSELVRTAFVPKPDCKFIVSDFSSIERVVLAWLAGETWVLDAYRAKRDLYITTASQMFRVPAEQIDKKSPLRQKGKVADLACVAEGQLVLTDRGLVPIESVTLRHRLWDGEKWVGHKGVVYKGFREVIEYDGLRATSNHFVWIKGKSEPVRFEIAAARGARLLQTGNDGQPLRVGGNHQPGEAMESTDESLLCPDKMHRLRKRSVAESFQFAARKISWVSGLLSPSPNTVMAGQTSYGSKTAMRKSSECSIFRLWSERNPMELSIRISGRTVDTGTIPKNIPQSGARPNRHKRKLRTRKHSFCFKTNQPEQQKKYSSDTVGAAILAIHPQCCNEEAFRGTEPRRSDSGCATGCVREKKKLETNRDAVRVYDIRDAGPHHRFTVSGRLVHNCGYGGSVGALKAMGALDMGLSEEELPPLVAAWRSANPNIVRLWWDVDRAAVKAVREKTETQTNGIRFSYQSGFLFITLLSGRRLAYVRPHVEPNAFGNDSVTYMGVGATKKWERIESYGPKFVENIVQAISRDILCHAMCRVEDAGYPIVMHVHDEIVVEAPLDKSVAEICRLMGETPPWASGLLLRADGYECPFYRKD